MRKKPVSLRDGSRVVVRVGEFRSLATVARRRTVDAGAWVVCDDEVPERLKRHPSDDVRARRLLVYPDDCEALP